MPSCTMQDVLDRAAAAYEALDHDAISQGFVHDGIANDLFGSQDHLISKDCKPFWEHGREEGKDMATERENARLWVKARVDSGEFTNFVKDVRSKNFLQPYPGYIVQNIRNKKW